MRFDDNFAYFSIKTHFVGAHYNCHDKVILMSIHNIGLMEKGQNLSFSYHQISNTHLNCSEITQ